MTVRRERLREQYEDALFALLMDEVADLEGQRLWEENQRLLRDPAAAVPERLTARCFEAIRRAFSKGGSAKGPRPS